MAELSILIPARNEMFLKKTIDDILSNIEADTEIITVMDGFWADPSIPQNDRVNVIHLEESIGQRAATNLACKLSKAKYVMKLDAHCSVDKGFDRKMLEAFAKTGDNVTMVPIMRNLWAFDWKCFHCGWKKYQGPTPKKCESCGKSDKLRRKMMWVGKNNPQSTSYSFDATPHFQYFEDWKHRPQYEKDKAEKRLTETMSLQGSCWMLTREKYWDLNICDEAFGGWGSQGIEVAAKTWLSGGRVLVNHNTWYAHLFRTQGGDFGFPYPMSPNAQKNAQSFARELFFNNKWEKQVYPLSWLVEKFWPVNGWTKEDLTKLKENTFEFKETHADPKNEEVEPEASQIQTLDVNSTLTPVSNNETIVTPSILNSPQTIFTNNHTNGAIHFEPKKSRKAVFTANVGNYSPELTNITYPFMKAYADSIDAEFVLINKRDFVDYPLSFEKFQVHKLGADYDWIIYMDSDCLVSPRLFDLTEIVPQDTVMALAVDYAGVRFKYDNYFRRDGRNIGAVSSFVMSSNMCLDVWEPIHDISLNEAISQIKATSPSDTNGVLRFDDYAFSRNIAKFGLKLTTLSQILENTGVNETELLFQSNKLLEDEKILELSVKANSFNTHQNLVAKLT